MVKNIFLKKIIFSKHEQNYENKFHDMFSLQFKGMFVDLMLSFTERYRVQYILT